MNPNQRIQLENEIENLEQFGRPEAELTDEQEESYSTSIGSFFMMFSYVETALDHLIITGISDRADESGYRVVKYFRVSDKINFANDHYRRVISLVGDGRRRRGFEYRLRIIISKLEEVSRFRNKIAHANWESISETGFVRTKIKEGPNGEGIQFVKLRLTPDVINRFTAEAIKLAQKIDDFEHNSPLQFI
jgi:hypothetical protein